MNISKIFLVVGALLAGIAVAAGAFGAHGLKNMVTPERLQVFEIGVRYQMYHALALLLLGWMMRSVQVDLTLVGWLFIAGIALFSGSLYVLVLGNFPRLGMVTPLGGVAMIAGWVLLAYKLWRG
ncbi:MAG: DUF423 domain-containing protein [Bacteroidetes Order II. Incertae sedis bacterium]|nr:DUF423 domain-containing protein [Bacteroidetes Order II. bacterium]